MPATASIAPEIDHTEAATAYIVYLTAHTAPLTVPVAAIKSHVETATAHIVSVTAHMDPFEPAATTHKKWRSHFYEIISEKSQLSCISSTPSLVFRFFLHHSTCYWCEIISEKSYLYFISPPHEPGGPGPRVFSRAF